MDGYDGYGTMTFAHTRRVLTVTLDRPDVLNAVSAAMHAGARPALFTTSPPIPRPTSSC